MQLIKFKHIHTHYDFYPDGIETEFSGVVSVDDDGEGGEIWTVEEIYANGALLELSSEPDKFWTAFLDTLVEAAQRDNYPERQDSITLPEGNLYDEAYPAPTRRNLEPTFEVLRKELAGFVVTVENVPGEGNVSREYRQVTTFEELEQ